MLNWKYKDAWDKWEIRVKREEKCDWCALSFSKLHKTVTAHRYLFSGHPSEFWVLVDILVIHHVVSASSCDDLVAGLCLLHLPVLPQLWWTLFLFENWSHPVPDFEEERTRNKDVTIWEKKISVLRKNFPPRKCVHLGHALVWRFWRSYGVCRPACFPNTSFKSKAGSQMVLMSWSLRLTVTWTKIVELVRQ